MGDMSVVGPRPCVTSSWEITWIVWVIAGILYGAIFPILNIALKDKK